tara:strand:+ start:1981 stop:2190 length:210 start_codon:yes stop_codon:yes gene_type:complete
MNKVKTITTKTTIIDQMNKFLKNCLNFELDLKNPGRTRIRTAAKKKAGISCSKSIFNYSRSFLPFEKIF